ncbi:MAG: transglycosylase SLT domain-containing protein [Muribaculaceae bacterium]|nr:transglycosylase SLT domain-containing protein [Muribaculaceae bacterium]
MKIHRTLKTILKATVFTACAILLAAGAGSCTSNGSSSKDGSEATGKLPDTLRVATLYGPTSYFIYRDEPMGYDYTLVDSLAKQKGMVLDLKVASSLTQAVEMLDSGTVDLIAYEVPITAHYQQYVIPCGPETETEQVLVQPKIRGEAPITDVTQLVGKDVYVESDSRFLRRLQNLDSELGGGINIHEVNADSIITEDLIGMVSSGELPLTIVDCDIARLNATFYPDLDVSLPVSFPQRSAWAVAPDKKWLADSIDTWFASREPQEINEELLKRYYEQTKYVPTVRFDFSKGYISKYDNLFKQYAPTVGWDWRLMAAQAYVESKFNTNARSWVGARGLMQVMPSTARGYRTNPNKLNNPETSLKVASALINDLDSYLKPYVPSDGERLKFVIAAYNVGIAHIYDAISLAKKHGLDPEKWDGNVEKALMMKMNPKVYRSDDVRYGYCRATETVAYVKQITNFYEQARREIPA